MPGPRRRSPPLVTVVASCLAACVLSSAAVGQPASTDAARAAYASAAALQNREAWDLAAEEWQALLAAHPQDPLALKGRYYLAICQLKSDHWPEARVTLEAVVASAADPATVALARWELGRGLFAAAQKKPQAEAFAAAATRLREFLEKAPGQPQAADARYFLGESLWQAGKRGEALVEWQACVRDHAQAERLPEVLYALGVGQAETGKAADAEQTLGRFAKDFSGHPLAPDVALWRSDLAAKAGRHADAEKILAPVAAKKGSRQADALDRLGQARWNQGNWTGAAEAFVRLASEHPGSPLAKKAVITAGRALVEADKPAEARPLLEQAAAGAGADAIDAAHRLAMLELDAKNPARALEVATRALLAAADRPGVDPALIPRLELDRAEALWQIPDRKAEAAADAAALVAKHPAAPAAGPALVMAALGLVEQKKPADALAKVDAFLAAHAATLKPEVVRDLRAIRAETLLALGRHAAAAQAYGELVAANPQAAAKAAWQARAAAALAAAKNWKAAHDALAAVTPALEGEERAEAMLLDATALVELGKPADAARILAELEKAQPPWRRRDEALLLAVRALREQGDSKAARAAAERFVKDFPDGRNADVAWYRLGQLRQEAGDRAGAIEAFAKCQAVNPKGPRAPWALLATGWCHEADGRLSDAIAAWTTLVDGHPKSPALAAALLARGDARRRGGDFKGALADAQRLLADTKAGVVELEPAARGEALLLEGLACAGEKKHAQAAAAFRTLLAEQPGFPAADRVLFELGVAEALDGKAADAAATFADLVKRFPKSGYAADAWLELGESRFAAEQWADAAAAYTAATAGKDPAVVEQARHKLGWTHVMRRDHAAAAEAFGAQLAAAPQGPLAADARALLGEALLALDKPADAGQALAAALADPAKLSSPELRDVAFLRAAEAAARTDQWASSLELAERMIAAAPQSPRLPQARYAAAWALQNLGRLDEAAAGYRVVADAERTETAARARLMEGEVLFEQGRHKEAVKAFFKVAYGYGERAAPPAFHPWQAQATFEAARCFEVLGKPDQARGLYAELADRYPDSEQTPAARKRLEALGPAPSSPPGARP